MKVLVWSVLLVQLVLYYELPEVVGKKPIGQRIGITNPDPGLSPTESAIERYATGDYTLDTYKTSDLQDIGQRHWTNPIKNLKRALLVDRLLHDVSRLQSPEHDQFKSLVKQYNDLIKVDFSAFKLEFSQDKANARFSDQPDFRYNGRFVEFAGRDPQFNTNDFLVTFFPHPKRKFTLVASNNRGLAAHVIAGKNVGRFKIVSHLTRGSNYGSFTKRKGNGLTLTWDVNRGNLPRDYLQSVTNTEEWIRDNSINNGNGNVTLTRTPK